MNVLNGGACLSRCSRASLWKKPCCKDVLKQTSIWEPSDEHNKPRQRISVNTVRKKLCLNNFGANYLTFYTQVRYKSDLWPKPPKSTELHRDLEFPDFSVWRKKQFKDPTKTTYGQADDKIGMTYVIGFIGALSTLYCTKAQILQYILCMGPSADVLALASIEIDISKIPPGGCMSFKWRGKPLMIKNRNAKDMEVESKTPLSALRDPETVEQRTQKPEWLVVIGICTHLGCVPIANSGDFVGGFYCPCHGSHFDNLGRARKGPAPTNMEIPPYKFLSDTLVLVG